MNKGPYIFKGMEWTLTPEAQKRLKELTTAGMDKDLAYILVEMILGEEAMYGALDER